MRIKCEHPVIIQHPRFSEFACRCDVFHTPGYDFIFSQSDKLYFTSYVDKPYVRQFSPRRCNVTPDNFEDFYFVDSDGCQFPAYLCVPCGKCSLCKEKKSYDWVIRCTAESAFSKEIPLFLTLTYAFEPNQGVCKRHLQLFLKRLRISLERDFDYKYPIRYFAVSEYGSEKHRAHYHVILWNFPSSHYDLTSVKSDGLLPFSNLLSKYIEKNWKYGYVRVGVNDSDNHSVEYCSKYMRKDSFIPDVACYDHYKPYKIRSIYKIRFKKSNTFMLCSRGSKKKGTKGIGYEFVKRNFDFYQRNPNILDCQFVNPLNGKKYIFPLPKYFSDKFYPCISKLVSKDTRDLFRKTLLDFQNLFFARKLFGRPYYQDLLDTLSPVLRKFSFLDSSIVRETLDSPIPNDFLLRYHKRYYPDIDLNHDKLYKRWLSSFDTNVKLLTSYASRYEDIERFARCKEIRSQHIQVIMSNLPEIDIQYELYKLRLRKAKDKLKRSKTL